MPSPPWMRLSNQPIGH
ncbi:hypothetical protein D018_2842A, partial [Vibrio parahaemolyticus VP2007-007]